MGNEGQEKDRKINDVRAKIAPAYCLESFQMSVQIGVGGVGRWYPDEAWGSRELRRHN